MNDLKWNIDLKRWNETISQYAAFTHKTAEEATFRQAKNLLFFLAKEMPESKFKKNQGITRYSEYVKNRQWVAGMIVAKYFKRKGQLIYKDNLKRRGVIGRAVMVRGSRGRVKFSHWDDGNRRAVYFTKAMAIKENARRVKMINARFGFAKLIPMKALDALKVIANKHGFNIGSLRLTGNKPNKKWQGENALIRVSKTDKRIDLSITSAYTFKSSKTMFGKSQDRNAEFYNNAIERALPKALSNTINDIQTYMQNKMRERAMSLNK